MKKTNLSFIFIVYVAFLVFAYSCKKDEVELPTLDTSLVNSITTTTANCGGDISSDGGAQIIARGLVYSISQSPTLENNTGITNEGTGAGYFSSKMTGLTPNSSYYVRAYATNSVGTQYGNQQIFYTSSGKISLSIESINYTTAITSTIECNVFDDGGAAITAKGVVWSITQDPTVENNMVIADNGTGIGYYNCIITELMADTTYYIRAYATNSVGIAYSTERTIKTLDGIAKLTTMPVDSISHNSAYFLGRISSSGGAPIFAWGFVWNTSPNPSITSNLGLTEKHSLMQYFYSTQKNLTPNTTYYVRAYATNDVGTFYGNQESFTTDGPGGTITDADGNEYNTVWIGGQLWMKENLKTTKYNDNTSIPNVTVDAVWAGLTTPAYCWYNNNIDNMPNGALYNWYTVDTKNLCPIGWHVPSDDEWGKLINYAGGSISATEKLKSTSGWYNNGNGTDIYGFSAIPSGERSRDGSFFGESKYADFWCSNYHFNSEAWGIGLNYDSPGGYTWINIKKGISVRCVRD